MKQFDAQEQQWIREISQIGESDEAVLTNVFDDVLFNKGVAINLDSGDLLYDMEKYQNVNDIVAIQKIIIKRALLIKYLEEHHYIYIINDSPESISVVGDKFKTSIAQKLPTEIADILRRTTYRIYADSSLIIDPAHPELNNDEIFGYQSRYAYRKARRNEVHGELKSDLSTWLLSANFSRKPRLNSDFISVDQNYDIFAVVDENLADHYICELHHDYKVESSMPDFAIPSL